MLLEAYAARRRRELAQLWLLIRHAVGVNDEDNPQSILPPLTAAAADADLEDLDGFDAVAMVRRAQQNEGR